MRKVEVKKYPKSPPKGVLNNILLEIRTKEHYGSFKSWELLVELLAQWLVRNADLTLASMSCKPFHGLDLKRHKELYEHIDKLDLFRHYYVAAKNQPWDYIGDLYIELGLVGPGQNMTPKGVVDMMIQMTYPEKIMKISTQLDPCVGTGRFLLEASIMFPEAPLILFGVEINLALYRACLVNMTHMSNHCFSLICANTLRLDPNRTGPSSKMWDLGNRWSPPDITSFYWKPKPRIPFLQRYVKAKSK